MQRSTGFQNEGFSQRSNLSLPGQAVAQFPSNSATRRYVLQEHQGFHVAPCGCLYDPRIHNIGNNGTHCELPPRLASPYYSHNFILNTAAPIPTHPDLQYLSPLYCSPSDQNSTIYQPPQVYYQQTPMLHSGRNQVAYSGPLFPFNGKTHMSHVPARFQNDLRQHQVQLQQHHNPRQKQNNQPPKALKSEDTKSKASPLPVDMPAQESSSDQRIPNFSPTVNVEHEKQNCIVSATCNKTQLMDDEEQMLAALDAVSEEELHELISNEKTANKDSASPDAQVSDALPDEVSLEDAMKMFDCIPFHNTSLNNSPVVMSGKLSSSADLNEYRTDSKISQDNKEENTAEDVTNAMEIPWGEISDLSLTFEKSLEDSMGLLALPKELISSDYEVPEIADIITTMDFFYSVSIYGLFNDEISNWNSHIPFYNTIKENSCNSGVITLPRPGESSPGTDIATKIVLDSVKKEKRHSTDMIPHPISKKCRIADSAALEAVQEFCTVSMSATMKKRLGIEDQ
ncbi:uncharacterized protein LOC119953498 [Scyliorhinus canicula]|uniref:uncharacterized protein LOC119953498 n=1 Tax=Scyliorhinus canicula TaxID=7830 RepID=UPI0018F4C80F|nr:uncharacterized protein LOC119953498 [Scyliorhinus canicula]